jgi:hypothetical protein
VVKQHPCLVPYEELPEEEKVYDRNSSVETLKLDNDDGELTKEAVEYYSKKLISLVEHMNSTIDDFRSFFKRGEPHKSSVVGILQESIRFVSSG